MTHQPQAWGWKGHPCVSKRALTTLENQIQSICRHSVQHCHLVAGFYSNDCCDFIVCLKRVVCWIRPSFQSSVVACKCVVVNVGITTFHLGLQLFVCCFFCYTCHRLTFRCFHVTENEKCIYDLTSLWPFNIVVNTGIPSVLIPSQSWVFS